MRAPTLVASHASVRGALVIGLLATLALAGCSASDTSSSGVAPGSATGELAPGVSGSPNSTLDLPATGKDGSVSTLLPAALADRSIISRASLTVRVKDVKAAARDAATRAASAGGIVAGEQTEAKPDHPESGNAVLTLRVPGNQLEKVLGQLADLGDLVAQDQSAEDVTSQVVDVAARLKSQQASVNRIRLLLARATTIGEIVSIESELSQREAAVESLAAQSKALADQTSLATVTATFVGTGSDVVPPVESTGFVGGLKSGWNAFAASASWLLTALGALLPFAALALLLAIPLRLIVRRRQPVADLLQPVVEA